MTAKPAGGRSVEEVLDLLKDPEFCADVLRTFREAAAIMVAPSSAEERQQQFEQLGQRFENRWGVPPPNTSELVDPDPRWDPVDAMASGRWGVVPIFPWTTNQQIRATIKNLRPVIRKEHKDALVGRRNVQLARWLETIGFERPTIARAVFGRRTGLRRPTEAAAIAHTSGERESQIYDGYLAQGFTPEQSDRRTIRRLRGSEAPASAAVRVAEQRYEKRLESLNEDLATPVQCEPLSSALTILFRALPDANDATIKQHAIAIREAFLRAAGSRPTEAEQPGEPTNQSSLEAVVSAPWAIVPVFPWTTDPHFRASVGKLRQMMGRTSGDGSGHNPAPAARPTPFEPLSDALIRLFRALSQDDLAVRRHAFETRAIFLQTGAL